MKNMIKNVMAHLMAPMAICLLAAGLLMFWGTAPTSASIPMAASQESWWLPWTWSMDESLAAANSSAAAMANQALAVDLLHQQYTSLVLLFVGVMGVAAITVAGLKQSKTVEAPAATANTAPAPADSGVTATKKRRSSKIPAQIPPGVEHPGARRKTAVTA